jgi:uncharacterized protein
VATGDGLRVRAIIEAGDGAYLGGAMADLPQFLYRIVPTRPEMLVSGPDEREMQAIAAHFAHLQKLAAEGTVLMAGRTVDTGLATFGIVVFQAASLADAEGVMRSDPAIARGVMHCELFPYRVAVWSDAWKPAA